MNPDDLPDPDVLDQLAEEAPVKVPLRDYRSAMFKLREKNYSYQEIAKWLTENLGVSVTRNQVSYIINATPDDLLEDEMEDREDAEDEQRPS